LIIQIFIIMQLRLLDKKSELTQDKMNIVQDFLKFCQQSHPLKKSLEIHLLGERYGHMTTGSEILGKIKILCANRMLIDILRTIAHEWVHEFARQRKIKLSGYNTISQENMANSESGIMVRIYQKQNPQFEAIIYE
jgi:hypothetical protein